MRLAVVTALLVSGPAFAADRHPMTTRFADEPCGSVVQLIDSPKPDMEGAGLMAMAFGYLLGSEAAMGIEGEGTVLQRFRAACGESPDLTGQAVLESMR